MSTGASTPRGLEPVLRRPVIPVLTIDDPARGVALAEAVRLLEAGIVHQKLFPAEVAGGVRYVDAIRAPVPAVRFCPTGGVDAARAGEYLARANVAAVGGSWVAPAEAVASGDWARVRRLAAEAAALARAWSPPGP